jgi:D-inositol-3-phosphate glycosyltransferase
MSCIEPDHVAPSAVPAHAPVERVALLSVHTCPLDQPGIGDSGGMNVYVLQVARRLAEMGVQVDIFSRWAGTSERIREPEPGVRVIHLDAGPAAPVPKEDLPDLLCEFLYSLQRFATDEGRTYDIVHSHYWLSGWVGRLAAEHWGVPLVQTFHTLGRVKNRTLGPGDAPEPAKRIAGEERVVAAADRILAPTHVEAADLVTAYNARPEAVTVVAPGVDTDVFRPGDRDVAKALLGLSGRTVVLFVGRLQPLKSPDVAIAAFAHALPDLPGDPLLVLVGGPSGATSTSRDALGKVAADLGVADRVRFLDPVPHDDLANHYRAADAVLVPSRSESFGLVALEASACGAPVIATRVGGLTTAVRDGVTGVLVDHVAGDAFGDALAALLRDPERAAAFGRAGSKHARRFDWRHAAARLLSVYEDVVADANDAVPPGA